MTTQVPRTVPNPAREKRYRLGVDVGGTFTDVTLFDERTGEIRVHKTSTTPEDQSKAILTGTLALLATIPADPSEVAYFAHGTTVATNAILEGKVARVGLITTRGFRDLLEIKRQKRPSLYDLFYAVPPPLVTRDLRVEVDERIDAGGRVIVRLEVDQVERAVARLVQANVEAIAILFLNSYINPAHELEAARIAREMSQATVWVSSEILPEFREFERLSTTVMNAALGPVMRTYLEHLEKSITVAGVQAEPHVMQSNGGVMPLRMAADRPANTLLSGPSAGVIGATYLAGRSGVSDLITFDMGGTSTDVCLVRGGASTLAMQRDFAGYPVRAPMVDVNSIGAGGGSVAWVDSARRLKVGPMSQGALPGPASYGLGGDLPTVTDAQVVLGRFGPDALLAGALRLHPAEAWAAIDRWVARPLGLEVVSAARAILRIANSNMVLAARSVSVQRGYDPRDFSLVAFGGAGPLHAVDVAGELGVASVIVPEAPGIVCALGLLSTDLRADFVRTVRLDSAGEVLATVNAAWDDLEAAARRWLDAERVEPSRRSISRSADMRYTGQNFEIRVPSPGGSWDDAALRTLEARFYVEHERAYGYSTAEPVQIVSLRVAAVGEIPKIALDPEELVRSRPRPSGHREVYWSQSREAISTPIYDRRALRPGQRLKGPAVVEQMDATTLVPPAHLAVVDQFRSLQIKTVDRRARSS